MFAQVFVCVCVWVVVVPFHCWYKYSSCGGFGGRMMGCKNTMIDGVSRLNLTERTCRIYTRVIVDGAR